MMKDKIIALLVITAAVLSAQDRGGTLEKVVGKGVKVGKQWAVFIAIDRYREWPPLSNPVRDAREIRDILRERYRIDTVRELYDGEATGAGIRRLFADLRAQTGRDDSVFVFYAGHGYKDEITKTGSWIPADAGHDLLAQTNWLPNNQVRNMLDALPAKHVFLVSDACFSGDILDTRRGGRPPPQFNNEYYRRAYAKVSRQAMTSGASESVPDASEFALRFKSALRWAEGDCIDPQYLFTQAREVQTSQPLLGVIRDSEHQEGGSFLFFLAITVPPSKAPQSTDPPPTPPAPVTSQAHTGSVTVTSEIPGMVIIDGKETGTRIKAQGSVTIADVSAGLTEVAVREDSGAVAAVSVLLRQGQTAAALIQRPPPAGFVKIPGGDFTMGSPESEPGRDSDEGPQHEVTVSAFYMGEYEVTQKEWREVMGNNPSNFKGDDLPVENVSWYDAAEYCNKRSQAEGLTPAYRINGKNVRWNRAANGYRLPTEAEWEYACRAGTTTAYNTGDTITAGQANYDWNIGRTTAVGSYAPNPWGLYDMHGNVWEWCWDWYESYGSAAQTDPAGPDTGADRVGRGGSWNFIGQNLRSAYRSIIAPSDRFIDLGFRLALP
jgi:formylglycine-generating enzyme required for sulfatase activity